MRHGRNRDSVSDLGAVVIGLLAAVGFTALAVSQGGVDGPGGCCSVMLAFVAVVAAGTFLQMRRRRGEEGGAEPVSGPLVLTRLLVAVPLAQRAAIDALVQRDAQPFRELTELVDHALSTAEPAPRLHFVQDLLTLVPPAEAPAHAAETVARLLEALAARDRKEGDVGFRDQLRTHSRVGPGTSVLVIAMVAHGGLLTRAPTSWGELRTCIAELLPIRPEATLTFEALWVPSHPEASFDEETLGRLYPELRGVG